MKKWTAALVVLPLSWLHGQTQVAGFDNIQYWAGSGTNRAALVLQWNDGLSPVSLAWGYRWDGEATGIDMLRAIAGQTDVKDPAGDPVGSLTGADDRLSLGLVDHRWGLSVLSIDYAPDGSSMRTQSDWYNGGYWEYLIRGGNFEYFDWESGDMAPYDVAGSSIYDPASWTYAPVGAADRPLIDGAWDAYSFALDFETQAVQQPMAAELPVPAASCAMHQGKPGISVSTKPGFSYRLEYSESMAGPWMPMGNGVSGTGGAITFVDETPSLPAQRFYRIAVTIP